jgi:DNA-directed RNA polymerase subunit RPC12/RpoP
MNRFRKFMYGRYGFDQFTRALIIFSLIISVITTLVRVNYLVFLSYIPFIYALYRTLSKDYQKRSRENMAYLRIEEQWKRRFNHLKLWLVGTKTHKYYTCSNCKQVIRVPRGKGKLAITCPKCRKEFVRRT